MDVAKYVIVGIFPRIPNVIANVHDYLCLYYVLD